jgi:uncharacterized membrane protein YdjX (TVP38/TMEM64 family)
MTKTTLVRLILFVLLVALLVVALRQVPSGDDLAAGMQHWRGQLGGWGLVLLAAAFTPACMILIPASLLILCAGYFYDVLPAIVAASLGSTFAAGVILLLGRTVLRTWIVARFGLHPRFRMLDRAVAEQGFKIVLLCRLSPVLPYILLNYAFSLTRVSLRAYLLGTWLGMLPAVTFLVYLGSTIHDLAQLLSGQATDQVPDEVRMLNRSLLVLGLVATLLVTMMLQRLARKALLEALPPATEADT